MTAPSHANLLNNCLAVPKPHMDLTSVGSVFIVAPLYAFLREILPGMAKKFFGLSVLFLACLSAKKVTRKIRREVTREVAPPIR
jgi:DNA mismatch repair ATPase MutS